MTCNIKVYVDFCIGKYISSIFPISTLLKVDTGDTIKDI